MGIEIRIDDRPEGRFVLKIGPVMADLTIGDVQALEMEAHAAVENHYLQRDEEPPRKPRYIVAVYEKARAYGGPEEGGWWFDTGRLVTSVSLHSEEAVDPMAVALSTEYPRTGNAGSVIYDGGDYAVYCLDRESESDRNYWLDERLEPIADFPRETPRYE